MAVSTFLFRVQLPRRVMLDGHERSREEFFEWVWSQFGNRGLLGIHEGTMLSAEAAERGLETESFTVDAAEAPRERDWIRDQSTASAEFYFQTRKQAESAAQFLSKNLGIQVDSIREQLPRDWDAEWKKSFQGVSVPPNWRISPPWVTQAGANEKILRINPGAGFGTGTHETTQLCLTCMTEVSGGDLRGKRVLDFGSGSGILAIGAALMGSVDVTGVEIDPLAIDNARENARLNGLEKVRWLTELPGGEKPFDTILANILKPVLLDCVSLLVGSLRQGGTLILSGLVEADVAPVSKVYIAAMGRSPEVRQNGEWRALLWRPQS